MISHTHIHRKEAVSKSDNSKNHQLLNSVFFFIERYCLSFSRQKTGLLFRLNHPWNEGDIFMKYKKQRAMFRIGKKDVQEMNKSKGNSIKIACSILFFFTSYGCNNSEFNKIKSFPETDFLKGKIVEKDYILGYSRIFKLNDSLALFFTLYDTEKCLKIINTNDFKLIKSSGKIGKGPNEIINPGFVYYDKLKRDIWLSCGGKAKIFKFPLDSVLSEDQYLPSFSIDIKDIFPIMRYSIKDDSLEYYNGNTDNYLLYKSSHGSITKLVKSHIYLKDNFFDNLNLNIVFFSVNSTNDKIALCYYREDVLIIANKKGKVLHKVKGPGFIDPLTQKQEIKLSAYNHIVTDDNYIFCLYSGKPIGENDNTGVWKMIESKKILVFDWDGKPVKEFVLEHSAYSFTIDRRKKEIITFSSDVENEIVIYHYKKI